MKDNGRKEKPSELAFIFLCARHVHMLAVAVVFLGGIQRSLVSPCNIVTTEKGIVLRLKTSKEGWGGRKNDEEPVMSFSLSFSPYL